LFGLTGACKPTQQVTKASARKDVKLPAVDNWKEAISEEGRFRILFPNNPHAREEGSSLKGFSLVEPYTNWFAYFQDFAEPRKTDDDALRKAYLGSIESIVKNNQAQLLSQKDVRSNGRLGTECVIVNKASLVSYIRAFLYLRRMYTLEVDRKGEVVTDVTVPKDVQQFFDSFAYWDVN
jgi:hypothetical protein